MEARFPNSTSAVPQEEQHSCGARADVDERAVRIRPLVSADSRHAARIYVAGLGDEEVRPVLPRHMHQAEAVFTELIQPNGSSWVVESEEGEVLGFALCQEPPASATSMVNWVAYRRHLPLLAAAWAWIMCRYLYRAHPEKDVLYLQSLIVDERWRDRGVGTRLLCFVFDEARRRGYRSVTLNLVEGNRARSLYDRVGFRRSSRIPVRLFKPIVHWSFIDCMEKRLPDQNS
jgi:ribosomal protein S18 acetylase RimI-like enzyme